jgi:hypothetical protein
VRNSEGVLIRAQALRTEHDASPLVMESLAMDLGYHKVELETEAHERSSS